MGGYESRKESHQRETMNKEFAIFVKKRGEGTNNQKGEQNTCMYLSEKYPEG